MKRAMSRGEWILITSPLVIFGVAAALYVRWKATTPAVLSKSPVPLHNFVSTPSGWLVALAGELDASNNRKPNTPWRFLRWNTKDGSLDSQLNDSRTLMSWALSGDGELLVIRTHGVYNPKTRTLGPGTVAVRRVQGGGEMASWSIAQERRYSRGLSFSPGAREIITFGGRLERHDLNSGKLLGASDASRVFSPVSVFKKISFSPDGRSVALLEDSIHLSGESSESPSQKASASTSSVVGGRIIVLEFPSLKPIFRPQGDLYSDCSWESNTRLWGISTFSAGHKIHKLVRAHIDIPSKQTRLDELQLPDNNSSWRNDTLSINGKTGQVLLEDIQVNRIALWGRDGQLKTVFNVLIPPTIKGATASPSYESPPRFSPDGRTLFRINGTDVERYDLNRFLPDPAPAQTSGL